MIQDKPNMGVISTNCTKPRVLFNVNRGQHSTDQCDCACAEAPVNRFDLAINPLLHNSRYAMGRNVRTIRLADSWFMAIQPLSPLIPVVINQSANAVLSSFRMRRDIRELADEFMEFDLATLNETIRQLAYSRLITPDVPEPSYSYDAKTLTAWIHTNTACNLSCDYCYLDKGIGSMSIATGHLALDAIVRSALLHGYGSVKLKYSGGEPTINLPLIYHLHDIALQLAEKNNVILDEVILSNGTLLTTQDMKQLVAKRIRLMISLDGIDHYHDANRRFSNGRGSFMLVSQSIDMAIEMGLTPDISITVSGRNIDGLPETIQYVLDRKLSFSLNFYRETNRTISFDDLAYTEERLIQGMRKVYRLIERNMPRYSLLGSLLDRASLIAPHNHTCGVGRDYMVIDHNGRIAKCQMEISKTITDIGEKDPLGIIQSDQMGIQNKSVDEKEGCRDCDWKYWCAGGCPLTTHRATGRYDLKSPSCSIYKMLLPEVIRLEGLRLIKYSEEETNAVH